jgi:hypothetical protein
MTRDLSKGIRGSTTRVGYRFQLSRINDLEVVDQNSASWNQIADWLKRMHALRLGANRTGVQL